MSTISFTRKFLILPSVFMQEKMLHCYIIYKGNVSQTVQKNHTSKFYLVGISSFNNVVNIYVWPLGSVCSTNNTQTKPSRILNLNGLQFAWMVKCRRRTCRMPISRQARIVSKLWWNALLLNGKMTIAIKLRRFLRWVGITIEVTGILCSVCWCWQFLETWVVRWRFMGSWEWNTETTCITFTNKSYFLFDWVFFAKDYYQ